MRKSVHWIMPFILLFLAVFAAGGCGKQNDDTLLRWAVSTDPGTLDPRKSEGSPEGLILFQLFEGLVTENNKGEIVPAAAPRCSSCGPPWFSETPCPRRKLNEFMKPASRKEGGRALKKHEIISQKGAGRNREGLEFGSGSSQHGFTL